MRIHTHGQLLELLDDVVRHSPRGDRAAGQAADFWTELLTREGHPLATGLPDENLSDWGARGLLGDLSGRRVLDVGCGNGRNSRWFAEQGAQVLGIDIAEPLLERVRAGMPAGVTLAWIDVLRGDLPTGPYDVIYDSGCFHHIPPHRRATYLQRVLPLLAPQGRFGVVTLAAEVNDFTSDTEQLISGDNGGGSSFSLDDLRAIFAPLEPVETRRVRRGDECAFGADFLNAAVFRRGPTNS